MGRAQRQRRKDKKKKSALSKKKPVREKPVVASSSFYDSNYKKLILIPVLLFLIAIFLIGFKLATTGDFMNKGVTLSGGVSVTVLKESIDKDSLLLDLENAFPDYDVNVRGIEDAGRRVGVLVESNLPPELDEELNRFDQLVKEKTGAEDGDVSTETIGSSLGAAFFQQTLVALLVAFIFMGIVIFLYFKSVVPSVLTIVSSFSDIIVTLAVINLLGISIGTAGIAAFLMLIGYSVDANIVLNMRTLKGTSGSIKDRIKSAFSTGLMMSVTTLVAITVAFIVAESPVLQEIMLIMMIGLLVDLINTWVQNAGLLRWYLESKDKS